MLNFLYIEYFFFLIPILLVLIILYFKWWIKNEFWPINDLKKVFKNNSIYYKIHYIILFIIFSLFITILAKPVQENTIEKINKNGIDIQIVLDLSYSMLAEDLKPNRLELAKEVLSNFMNNIKTDRVWIIVYAWKTFTSLPLSFDYNIIKKTINDIDINIINQHYSHMQWTAMWDALMLAWKSFWKNNDREKVIILLTDWEANKWLHPILALKYLKEKISKDIKVYTIWIWWDKKTTVKIVNNVWMTQVMDIWGVDEKILNVIANESNWIYFRAKDRNTFEEIFTNISKLEKIEIVYDVIKINKEKNKVFLYLLICFFLIYTWFKYIKNIK